MNVLIPNNLKSSIDRFFFIPSFPHKHRYHLVHHRDHGDVLSSGQRREKKEVRSRKAEKGGKSFKKEKDEKEDKCEVGEREMMNSLRVSKIFESNQWSHPVRFHVFACFFAGNGQTSFVD